MARSTTKTTIKDSGHKALKAVLVELGKGPHVRAGLLHDAPKEGGEPGMTVVEAAIINEYGTSDGHIPERAAFRTSAIEAEGAVRAIADRLLVSVVSGKTTLDRALDAVGLTVTKIIKRTLRDWDTPPNARRTIQKKGADNPLIDTGQTVNSVTYEKVK